MSNKLKFIIIVLVMVLLFGFVIFMNFNQIENYINNKQWEVVTPSATIYLEKYIEAVGCGDKLLCVESDQINAFSNTNIADYKQTINFKDAVVDGCRDYAVVGENNGSKLMLFNEKGKLWEFDTSGEIMGVSVNKNGYVACIYSKSGYKSLVKVINPNGEELFTNYLASTYAVDVDISNDNKFLAIAEVNTDGINLESDIKIVDINKTSDKEFKTVKLENNALVLDVEYTDKNDLLVHEDSMIQIVSDDYSVSTIKEFKTNSASHVSISNENTAIVIEKKDTGIFNTDYILKIYDGSGEEPKEYVLDGSAKAVYAQGKMICIDVGNELLFLNTNGRLLKRCRISGQVRDIKLYSNGTMAGVVFKDRIEIIKL